MTKKSKVTRIEKKYKDKKTGEYKSITIDYSKVADRVLEFRQDCMNGDIKTNIEIKGEYIFASAIIKKDKADINSAEANGHAIAKLSGYEKEFEKLETLSVGRALAFLGYGASGEIASSEEMEEFNKFKMEKHEQLVSGVIKQMEQAKTLAELQTIFVSSKVKNDKDVITKKDELKLILK